MRNGDEKRTGYVIHSDSREGEIFEIIIFAKLQFYAIVTIVENTIWYRNVFEIRGWFRSNSNASPKLRTDGTVGDGKDAGGNTGGIIGRVKNETSAYKTIINNCYFKGKIIAKGQYNAGILGDLDNGAGYCEINNCYSEPIIIYNDVVLDGRLADVKNEEVQMYAHKNSNPIIGRAVLSTGEYNTNNN